MVVTGGAKGIAFGIAAAFDRRGDTAVVFDTYHAALSRSMSRLTSAGINAVGLPVDALNAIDPDRFMALPAGADMKKTLLPVRSVGVSFVKSHDLAVGRGCLRASVRFKCALHF